MNFEINRLYDRRYNIIDTKRPYALKVLFLNDSAWDDTFIEPGMIAWLVKIEECGKEDCYNLHFDFTEFFDHNQKYFIECFHSNIYTERLTADVKRNRKLFTAIESGNYEPKLSYYFGDLSWSNERIQEVAHDAMVVLDVDYPYVHPI